MEKRNVSITLEKAKEWYNKSGKLKEVALQAYKEEELIDWPTNINDPRLNLPVSLSCIPVKIIHQWKLYKLLELLNPKSFDPGYNPFYVPRIWWYKNKQLIPSKEVFVGEVRTIKNEILYVTVGGASDSGFGPGFFAGASADVFSLAWSYCGVINQLKCATPEIQEHLEKYFWKDIIKAYYDETILKIEEIV